MHISMSFEAINPTVAYTITELLFLPVENMLQKMVNQEWLVELTNEELSN